MITGIREITIVKEGGKIEISSPDLPIGMEVEVIVLVETNYAGASSGLSSQRRRNYNFFV